MPYAVPTHSPTSPTASTSTSPTSNSPITTRANLRRSRSSFTDEQGPGAFVAMGALPRRRSPSKKAVFHLTADDDSPQDEDGVAPADDILPSLNSTTHVNGNNSPHSSFNTMMSGRFSPSVPTFIELPSSQTSVPFPTSSPLPSPPHTLPARSMSFSSLSTPRSGSIPRVPSTPVILSNGKPLKSSLKSSLSSPNISADLQRTKHLRAQSAPSTPNLNHKNVHFAEKDAGLESVKVFKRSGKPASLSKASGDETETETEAENNPTSNGLNGYPFPSLTPSSFTSSTSPVALPSQTASRPIIHEVDPSPNLTSVVPQPSTSPHANVHLETITLPRTRPPTLRGTVLVRNVAFEKSVAVRFTLDDWQTTSEVTCRHVVSLPGLPPPFPRTSRGGDGVEGDVATRVVAGEEEEIRPSWDRFSFTIRLEDYESKLSERTLFLVTRFSSPAGEWWDNNEGKNYRVGFRRAPASPLASPLNTPSASVVSSPFVPVASLPSVAVNSASVAPAHYLASANNNLATAAPGLAQQRTFSAPSALRYTPMTGALAGVPLGAQSGFALGGRPGSPVFARSLSSPYPPRSPTRQDAQLPAHNGSSPARSHSVPSPLSIQAALPGGRDAQGRQTVPRVHRPNSPPSPSATHTSSYIKRRLSLSNYVAPGASPITSPTTSSFVKPVTPVADTSGSEGLVTPPITPPNTVRSRSASLPSEFNIPEGAMHEKARELEDDIVTKPAVPKVSIVDAPSVEAALPESEVPFSPTRTTMPFLNFEGLGLSGMVIGAGGGLISPPRSRDASEDGGSGEGGRSSPTLPVLDLRIPGAPGSINLPPTSQVSTTLPNEQANGQAASPADVSPASESTPNSSVSSVLASPVTATLSTLGMGGPSAGRVDTTDSSYAAFVRQWCFAQSAPPTPGVQHSPDASGAATPKGSPPAGYVAPGGIVGAGKKWNGAGFGFPSFNFGAVNPDAGMVGGESHL